MELTSTDLVNEYKHYTKDSSAVNVANGKLRMGQIYGFLLAEANNYVIERTKYGNSKENQRSYLLPPDYIKMKTVRFKSGDTWYPLEEVKSMDQWNEQTATPRIVSIPSHWIVINEQGNVHLELDGIPDADGSQNIEIVYEGFQNRLLFPDDYNTGTISISNGSATVTGSSAVFTSAMVGRFIRPTNGKFWYDIKSFTSTIVITLVNYFQETTISGSGYVIAEVPRLPKEFHYALVWGATELYYLPTNAEKAKDFGKLFARDLLLLQSKYKSKSKGAVTKGRPVSGRYYGVPRNYPTSAIG